MSGYNNFPGPDSKLQVCVIASDDQDKASDQSCNQKLYSPLDHGDQVSLDDLQFSNMIHSPSQFSQQSFMGIMDPGTPVVVLKQLGMNGGIVLGQSNTVKRNSGGSGGGGNLASGQRVSQLSSKELKVSVPPDIQEADEEGTKIRKIKEKGKKHKLDLLDGLPLHGALFSMAGFRLPEVKNVPTAKQTNDQMMNNKMMQQMIGQIMSLGQMMQGLMGNRGGGGGGGGYQAGRTRLFNGGGASYGGGLGNNSIQAYDAPTGTPMYDIMQAHQERPEIQAAINSLGTLLQGYEATGGVAFYTGDVVHEETYLQNAKELLTTATSVDDLMYVLQRLQWDKSLFGQEKLALVENQLETAWGVALQQIDVDGNIILTYDQNYANTEMSFANNMMSNTTSPGLGFSDTYTPNGTGASMNPLGGGGAGAGGGGGGSGGGMGGIGQIAGQLQGLLGQVQGMSQNMFGESAGTVKDMWKRMTRDQENDAKKMHEKLNQDQDAKKLNNIIKKTTEGGNPIDMEGQDFESGGIGGFGGLGGLGGGGLGF